MVQRYRQADPRWADVQLGHGPATIGRAGCLLVAYCEAARILRGVEVYPPLLNASAIEAKAFLHSSLIQPAVAPLIGLKVSERITGDTASMRGAIGEALRSGRLVVAHVDHTGDAFGDHFVLVHREHVDTNGKRYSYADPATGRDADLNATTLEGSTLWGLRPKTYRVRGFRTVHA